MLLATAALTLALQDIPAGPALWPLSPPPVLDVWAPIRGPVGVWEETPNKLRSEVRRNEVIGIGLLGNTAFDTTIGVSTRLDPPPPDAWISTQNELKDGRTWVLSWAPEVAGDGSQFEEAFRTLTARKHTRTVIRVESPTPLLDCERLRFGMGALESKADWILAFPPGDPRAYPGTCRVGSRFMPGTVSRFKCLEPCYGYNGFTQMYAGMRPTTEQQPLAVQKYEELVRNDTTEQLVARGAEVAEAKEAALESILYRPEAGYVAAWIGEPKELARWCKDQEAPRPSSKDEPGWRAFWELLEFDIKGFKKVATENRKTDQKALRDMQKAQDKNDKKAWQKARDKYTGQEEPLRKMATVFSHAQCGRRLDLAIRGRALPLQQTMEAHQDLLEWLEDDPNPAKPKPWYGDAMSDATQFMDALNSLRDGHYEPQFFELLNQEEFERLVEGEEAMAALVGKVKFDPKRLAGMEGEVRDLMNAHPDTYVANRCAVWLLILSEQ